MLSLIKSFELLESLPLAKYKKVESEADLSSLSFPYYLKVSSVIHKTEEKAVLKCNNLEQAKENLSKLKQKFPDSEIIIQEEIDGIEMIIGLKKDPVFGRLLMIGFGGIFTKTVNDVSFRALPIEREEIVKMIEELKFFQSLISRKKFALKKFLNIAEKISKLNAEELDLNPVIINEEQAVIVDARVKL